MDNIEKGIIEEKEIKNKISRIKEENLNVNNPKRYWEERSKRSIEENGSYKKPMAFILLGIAIFLPAILNLVSGRGSENLFINILSLGAGFIITIHGLKIIKEYK